MGSGKHVPADPRAARGTSLVTDPISLPADDHVLVHRFHLTCTDGPDAGMTYPSVGARTVIGSDKTADVALRDRTVSRFHCEITLKDGRAELKDLGSRNGTFVGALPVFH